MGYAAYLFCEGALCENVSCDPPNAFQLPLISPLHQDGQPPLSLALAAGHGKVVEVLLKNGADHTYTDRVCIS